MALEALTAVALGRERVTLLIVVVPDVAPKLKVLAAWPIERFDTPLLKIAAVPAVEVILPLLTARVPLVVILPLEPFRLKWVAAMLFAPKSMAVVMLASERSRAVVTFPPLTPAIFKPTGRAVWVFRFWIRTNSLGLLLAVPSALKNWVSPVEFAAVVITKFESMAVSAKVKEIFRLLVVVMVFPPT